MKKQIMIFSLVVFCSTTAYAEDMGFAKSPSVPGVIADELIDDDLMQMNRKIKLVADRMSALEDQVRFQDERIRRLDRQVTDLKRR